MVSSLFFIAENSFFQVERSSDNWHLHERTFDWTFMSIAADPFVDGRIYAGTFDHGLLVSTDYGATWNSVGAGIGSNRVMSVAVSQAEKENGFGVVWAGTEPSMLYRSEDGGDSWAACPNILNVPSVDTWYFPPRPHTHHVHSIQPDLFNENVIYVGIELGGVLKSTDKGQTWEDRKEHSQFDCHSLTMNPFGKGRIYEAAGGGYAESFDGGHTWQTYNEGLGSYTYIVDIAVDSADPNTVIISSAQGPRTAYRAENAATKVFRREKDQPWELAYDGLPEERGSTVFSLVSHPTEPGTFFAVNNRGVYRSIDRGKTWEYLQMDWKDIYKTLRIRKIIAI